MSSVNNIGEPVNARLSSTANRQLNAISVFMDHVKQVFSTTPPITRFTLYAPVIMYIVDKLILPLIHVQLDLSSWTCLNYKDTIAKFQIYRFLTYPISTVPFVQIFITALWLIPEMFKLEKRQGSLRFLWIMTVVFTLLPGFIYVASMKLLFWSWPSYGNTREQEFAFRGMTGWVVGLIFWAYLGDENDGQQEQQDRMIAGAIRLPNRLWPALVFIFFVFLGTDSSIVLNLVASIIGFLYAKKRLSFLIPSDEKFLEYEGKTWLRTLTNSPNYVSIDSAGEGYLPIFIPTAYPPNSSTTSHNSNNSPRTPNSSFPGQGYRLDS